MRSRVGGGRKQIRMQFGGACPSFRQGSCCRRRGSSNGRAWRKGFGDVSDRTHRRNARLPTGLESAVLSSRNQPRPRLVEDPEPRFVMAVRATGETTRYRDRGVARPHHLADSRLRTGIRRRCRQHDGSQESPDAHTCHGFSGVECKRIVKVRTKLSVEVGEKKSWQRAELS